MILVSLFWMVTFVVNLSRIPTGGGSARNENLHKNLRSVIARSKLGCEPAEALLATFFYVWNERRNTSGQMPTGCVKPILSYRAELGHHGFVPTTERFGIIPSSVDPEEQHLPSSCSPEAMLDILQSSDCPAECEAEGAVEVFSTGLSAVFWRCYFFLTGKVGNVIGMAMSQTLRMNVVFFTSLEHMPVVPISPLVPCVASEALLLGYSAAPPGLYHSVIPATPGRYVEHISSPKVGPSTSSTPLPAVHCACGRGAAKKDGRKFSKWEQESLYVLYELRWLQTQM